MGDPNADTENPVLKEEQDAQVCASYRYSLPYSPYDKLLIISVMFLIESIRGFLNLFHIWYINIINYYLVLPDVNFFVGRERIQRGCYHIAYPCCQQSTISRSVVLMFFYYLCSGHFLFLPKCLQENWRRVQF